jgi:hypothetical protein
MKWHSRWFCASKCFWQQFWGRPFPVSLWQCPCAQSEVHTEMVCWDQCGKTWLSCRALTSTPLNPFGMKWNADCESGLIAPHPCPTSLMIWMEASPRSNVPTSSGKPSQKTGGCYSSKGGTNSILMPGIRACVHILLYYVALSCSQWPKVSSLASWVECYSCFIIDKDFFI